MLSNQLTEILKTAAVLYPNEFREPLAARLWTDALLWRTDPEFVLAQLHAYARQSSYITLPEFLQFLRDADLLAQDQAKVASERADKARSAAQASRQSEDAETRKRREEWERIDAAIAGVSDEDLIRLASAAIEDANKAGRLDVAGVALLKRCVPKARQSKSIKALVYPKLMQPELVL